MATIVSIIGTRPEIIKMAPVIKELDRLRHKHVLVHSGQHYDLMMDEVFFKELGLRKPDSKFELKNLPPYRQIASTLDHIGDVVEKADMVIVQGDTNTTLSGALLANKLVKVLGHVEAGLRSFDKTMPEEVNRTLTDHMSTLLFCPTKTARQNLREENLSDGIHVVGNTVVDALLQNIRVAERRSKALDALRLDRGSYFLVTFHRAENADNADRLAGVLRALSAIAMEHGKTALFPIHPRTRKRVHEFGLDKLLSAKGLRVVEPVGYFDMLMLEKNAFMILTDSGGLQEEACTLLVPCVTLRENTERPETLEIGCNVLAGTERRRIERAVSRQSNAPKSWKNPYGNGTTGRRIARIVNDFLDRGEAA